MFLVYTNASWLASRCDVTDGRGARNVSEYTALSVGLGAYAVSAGGHGTTTIVAFRSVLVRRIRLPFTSGRVPLRRLVCCPGRWSSHRAFRSSPP